MNDLSLLKFVSSNLGTIHATSLHSDLLALLDHYPIKSDLFKIPLSQINDLFFSQYIETILKKYLSPELEMPPFKNHVFERIQLKGFEFSPRNIIIVPKILKEIRDYQTFLGKLWWYAKSSYKLIIVLYDPIGLFRHILNSIPSNCQVILHPKPHLPQQIWFDPNLTIDRGGYSLYDAMHPFMDKIDLLMNELIRSLTENNMLHSAPSVEELATVLDAFPIDRFLSDPLVLDPIMIKDKEFNEVHLEWLLTRFLRKCYPDLVANQYRTQHHIFDVYLADKIIVEFKYLRNRSEYFRLIGQIWDYACYEKDLLIYIYNPKRIFRFIQNAFPENSRLIVREGPDVHHSATL